MCFLGGGARFDLAAPRSRPLVRCTQIFTSTVSPWQGRRHGFKGGVQVREGERTKKFRVPSQYSWSVRIEGGGLMTS